MKLRVGVTGQNGLIGYHLVQHLRLESEKYEIIPFERSYFDDSVKLRDFVSRCDAVVHLAAVHTGSGDEIYSTNLLLVDKLISAISSAGVCPHVLFSSSIHEVKDTPYGRCKKIGASHFDEWARRCGAVFTHFVIPNTFGPFGIPFNNSVVSTFCYQLTHGEVPRVFDDVVMTQMYVGDVVNCIISHIDSEKSEVVRLDDVTEISVTALLEKLECFKSQYFEKGMIPKLESKFDLNLFNTFRSYANDIMPFVLELHSDKRGNFVEAVKEMTGGQVSFSTTVPGVVRGNHFHLRKIERFCVISGDAVIKTRRIGTDEVNEYYVSGKKPVFVDMPVCYTHNIKNVGDEELLTLFWINEIYDEEDSDTFYEEV